MGSGASCGREEYEAQVTEDAPVGIAQSGCEDRFFTQFGVCLVSISWEYWKALRRL